MIRYLFLRLLRWLPGLLLVLFITYALAFYGAGDPIRLMFLKAPGDVVYDEERIEAIREAYGLDRPFLVQFGDYLSHLLRGDLGRSIISNRPVSDMIRATYPVTLQLGLAATVLLAVIGIPLGVLAGLHHNRWPDNLIVSSVLFFQAVPVFVAGPLLMVLLVLVLKVMKVPWGWKGLLHPQSILPIVLLALGPMAIIVRQTRSAVLEVLSEDYVRTARAKGLPQSMVVIHHVLRPVLTPVITSLGLVMITFINGAIFLEMIFGLPGFGRLSLNSMLDADHPAILGTTLFGTLIVMVSNLLVDLVYPLLDPRIT